MHFWYKSRTQSGLAELVELVVHEAIKDTTLSDSTVSNNDNFYLSQILVHFDYNSDI